MARISKYNQERHVKLPVYGAGADIAEGSFLRGGQTPATDNGMLISANGASALPDIIGILSELHDFSEDADTLIDGTAFVTHPVELVAPTRVIRIEFDLASLISATQAVSTTTITLTSLENNIDGAFLYVVSGTGAGQTNYLTASAAGSATLKAAFATSLDTTSRLIKILPRFHRLIGLNAAGTKLSNQAAAGGVTGTILDLHLVKGGTDEQLDPTKHDDLVGLNNARGLHFEADIWLRDTNPYSID